MDDDLHVYTFSHFYICPWWRGKTNEGVQHTRALLETRQSGDDSRISCRPRWRSCSAQMKAVFIVWHLQSSEMFESSEFRNENM